MSKAKSAYSLRAILLKAWAIAREGAARFGGKPRAYLAASLRLSWAEAEASRAAAAERAARLAWTQRATSRTAHQSRQRAATATSWALRNPPAPVWLGGRERLHHGGPRAFS